MVGVRARCDRLIAPPNAQCVATGRRLPLNSFSHWESYASADSRVTNFMGLTNTGATPLKYLAISSVATNDVLEYPDSGKLMAVSDFGADAEGFHFIGRANTACGYWEDEPDSAD